MIPAMIDAMSQSKIFHGITLPQQGKTPSHGLTDGELARLLKIYKIYINHS